MPVRYAAALVLALLSSLFAGPAHAQGAAEREASRERFRLGAAAYSEGRFKDAIDLFLEADRVAPNPAFSYNIGQAYEELGDAANALRWYRSYLRELPGAPDRGDVEPRVTAAERHLAERGVQQVTVVSSPDGATVSIDGKRVGVTPWTDELRPGTHQLGLELRGFSDESSTFELPADHAIDVTLPLRRIPERPTVVVEPRAVEPVVPPSPGVRIHPVTWATLGVGVAGLGVALGLELSRSAAEDSARHAPTNLVGKEEYERATSLQTAARVAVVAGGAVAALGAVLLYFDLSSRPSSERRVGALVGCPRGACGVGVDGAF